MSVGTISQNNFQRYGCLFLSIVVLTSGMSGCVKNPATASSAEFEQTGQLKNDTENSPTPTIKTNFVSVESYTTENNPTRTIETPSGLREVYDPAQDKKVIAEFAATPKRELLIMRKTRHTQLKEFLPMGCVRFEDYSSKYGVDDSYACDVSKPTNKLDSFSTKLDCVTYYTGLYRPLLKPPVCPSPVFDRKLGKVKVVSHANPKFNNFPMQDRCFTQKVRINYLNWDVQK